MSCPHYKLAGWLSLPGAGAGQVRGKAGSHLLTASPYNKTVFVVLPYFFPWKCYYSLFWIMDATDDMDMSVRIQCGDLLLILFRIL